MAVILAYLFYFVAASASPLQRRWLAVNREASAAGQIHFAFQVVAILAILGLLIPLFEPFRISGNIPTILLLSLATGVCGAGYFWANYVAQKHVEAGVTTLVSNIYTPITILLATVFLQEALTPTQLAGTVLLLIGVVVVCR